MAYEVAGQMVVQNVRLRDQPASQRPSLPSIRVFKPVKQARDKVRSQHTNDNFDKDLHNHTFGKLNALVDEELIDKNRLAIDCAYMNPHHLELFYYVAKCRGVSHAARQMPYGIQQPSVSAQVNALERDLGVALFERRPFKLTPAGQELFKFVEPFFGKMAEIRERVQGGSQLRIGASPIIFRDY